jgi:putative alpha-1,2-mannosidase
MSHPVASANGNFSPEDYCSPYNHQNESAHPGYYQVYLDRYHVNVELTSTLRCAFHKYTFRDPKGEKLIADLSRSNERVRDWEIVQEGTHVFKGFQQTGEKMYFYAVANHAITNIGSQKSDKHEISVVSFSDEPGRSNYRLAFRLSARPMPKKPGERNAWQKFSAGEGEADRTWEALLSKIKVEGGTERQKGLFYSTLYRSFLWPALRSDVNGEFTDMAGHVVNPGFNYYTEPSLWDDYRNKLVLLGMLSPQVAADVIKSLIDKGEKTGGFMPTFFHGDHAAPFIAGVICAESATLM